MHLAARNGHPRAVRLLAAHKGYVNACDKVSVCVYIYCVIVRVCT